MTAQCVQIMNTAPARRHDERLLQGVFLKKKKKSRHASYNTADTKRGLFLRVHEEKHKPECIVSTRRSLLKHSECFCLSGQHTGARLRFYPKKEKKRLSAPVIVLHFGTTSFKTGSRGGSLKVHIYNSNLLFFCFIKDVATTSQNPH